MISDLKMLNPKQVVFWAKWQNLMKEKEPLLIDLLGIKTYSNLKKICLKAIIE